MDSSEYRLWIAEAEISNVSEQEAELEESAKRKMEALKAKGKWPSQ